MKKILSIFLLSTVLASCGQVSQVQANAEPENNSGKLSAQVVVTGVRPGSCNVGFTKKPPCYFPGAGSGSTFYEGPYRITNTGGAGMEVRVYYYWNDVEFRYCNLDYGQSCDTGWYGNSIRTYVKVWPKTSNGTSFFNISPY